MRVIFLVVLCCVAVNAIKAGAETRWPSFQAGLVPERSNSPNKARLPSDVSIRPPGSGISVEKAAFSGIWVGWACRNRACSTRLAVERVTKTGATIVYAFSSRRRANYKARLKAKFVGGELIGTLPNSSARVIYRIRRDGHLDFMWKKKSAWVSGILAKKMGWQ